MLYQQFFFFLQNQEITEQIKGDIKPWADVSKIAGVFNGCFASISLRRSVLQSDDKCEKSWNK